MRPRPAASLPSLRPRQAQVCCVVVASPALAGLGLRECLLTRLYRPGLTSLTPHSADARLWLQRLWQALLAATCGRWPSRRAEAAWRGDTLHSRRVQRWPWQQQQLLLLLLLLWQACGRRSAPACFAVAARHSMTSKACLCTGMWSLRGSEGSRSARSQAWTPWLTWLPWQAAWCSSSAGLWSTLCAPPWLSAWPSQPGCNEQLC